jgi:transposase
MTKKYTLKNTTKTRPKEREVVETYLAPRPPSQGKIIGLDCHPDTFTAAVFVGQTPHDAKKISSREHLGLEALLEWAGREFGPKDLFLLEAGSNSFEVCKQLGAQGLNACVLESCHVGKHAKTYADNDKMAAARIALVYLAGNAPCVWVPDEQSRERRELLHAYNKAVAEHTAATNALKAYLNGHGVRLSKRNPETQATREWLLKQHDWSALQGQILDEHLGNIIHCKERRKRFYRLIGQEMTGDAMMLRCMKLLGVGIVSAFGLLAVIGDVRRFHSPEKLVAYIGLNPGQRQSGKGKDIRLGVGKRGRGDIRNLLIQGAQAVLRMGKHTTMGQWGWKLFARKGNRNVAVAAIARKMLVQVWHMLQGHPTPGMESDKSFTAKLQKLAVVLGTGLRTKLSLGVSVTQCVCELRQRSLCPQPSPATSNCQP